MPAPTRPTNYKKPFADTGTRNVIPDAPTGTNKASFSEGFPPVTMLPVTSGGVPPAGDDFNGILYDATQHIVWINAGGQYQFDAALSTAMGGYPQGMVLQNTALTASYVSLVNNNTTDFNATPASIGVIWGAYSGDAFSNVGMTTTGGNTTLSAIQAMANMITVTGLLTADATITFPATAKQYMVVNSTTGAFTLTAIPAGGGTGVIVKQGRGDGIFADGTNIRYAQSSAETQSSHDISLSSANCYQVERAASRVGGFFAASGPANAYTITTVPPTTTYGEGQTFRFKVVNACTGPSTLDAGAGAKAILKGDGDPTRNADMLSTMVNTVTYVAALDKFILGGLVIPDLSIDRPLPLTSTQTLSAGKYLVDTSGGAFACNLAATPTIHDTIEIWDIFGNFQIANFTLLTTGSKVISTSLGDITTLTCDTKGITFRITYNGTKWKLF